MKITEKYFNSLDIDNKANIVFKDADFIGTRIYYNQILNLYYVDNLFIEVWYLPNENRIYKIEPIKDNNVIDLYIEQNI